MIRRPLLLALAAVCLWGVAVAVAPAARRPAERGEDLLYYPSGRYLRQAARGFEHAAAALAWLRVVQYYGEHAKTDMQFEMMYHLCDIVTDLDPRFEEPYIFGSFVLLTEGRQPEEGLRLLAKGRAAHPASWRIQFESGFVAYLVHQDYAEAARYFRRAAANPDAPGYAHRFAAYLSEKAGSLEAALLLWREYRERTTNPELLRRADEAIAELEARLVAGPEPGR